VAVIALVVVGGLIPVVECIEAVLTSEPDKLLRFFLSVLEAEGICVADDMLLRPPPTAPRGRLTSFGVPSAVPPLLGFEF